VLATAAADADAPGVLVVVVLEQAPTASRMIAAAAAAKARCAAWWGCELGLAWCPDMGAPTLKFWDG